MKEILDLRQEILRCAQEVNLGGQVLVDEPLARHTSLRVGGPADLHVLARKEEDLKNWIALAQSLGIPYRVIGGGTNLLVSDSGVRGLVIENRTRDVQIQEEIVVAASGTPFANLARRLAKGGWAGLEWAAGIPGTVGGAVVNNAGAYGGDVAAALISITLLVGSDMKEVPTSELGLAYRHSNLKGKGASEGTVLAARFRVARENPPRLLEQIAQMDEHRKRTQPKEASVGSIFRNPPEDFAGRLLEATGLKGERVGGAQISPLHANFFVNLGGAKAQDVLSLIHRAREKVAQKFGIVLELEIELIGDWDAESLKGLTP